MGALCDGSELGEGAIDRCPSLTRSGNQGNELSAQVFHLRTPIYPIRVVVPHLSWTPHTYRAMGANIGPYWVSRDWLRLALNLAGR